MTNSLPNDAPQRYLALLVHAQTAAQNAYAPYSRFKVGAALLTTEGRIIAGCNVENAAYGSTICAERAAICTAVSLGYKPGDFEAIAIAANAPNFSPCGSCRQVLQEFGEEIIVIFEFKGETVLAPLRTMLPSGFQLSGVDRH